MALREPIEAYTLDYTFPSNGDTVKIHFCPYTIPQSCLDMIQSGQSYAMDIESTGLNVGAPGYRIRMLQIGTEHEAWVFPVEVNMAILHKLIKLIVEPKHGQKIITASGIIDWVSLKMHSKSINWYQLKAHNLSDVYILSHHWDTRGPNRLYGAVGHSVEALTRKDICAQTADKVKGMMTVKARELGVKKQDVYATVPINDEDFVLYSGMDCVLEARLARIYENRLAASPLHSPELLATDYEDFMVRIRLAPRGLPVDKGSLAALSKELKAEAESKREELLRRYGVTSPNSTKQVADALIAEGHKLTKTTAQGRLQVNDDVLQACIIDGSEVARLVVAAKRPAKWDTAYVGGIREAMDKDGVVHPMVSVLGARTGRDSVSNPACQQFPSTDTRVRGCFTAPPGMSFVSIDYSKQELRLAAALSRDPKLLAAFEQGSDPVNDLATELYGEGYSPRQYLLTKIAVYAMCYGAGPKTISAQTGMSIAEATRIKKAWKATYRVFARWSRDLIDEAKFKGYITGIRGRLMIVDRHVKRELDRSYAAVDYMLQNAGREILSAAMRTVDRSEWARTFRLPVHDEMVFIVPDDDLPRFLDEVPSMLETEVGGVHFPVSAEVTGRMWSGHYG